MPALSLNGTEVVVTPGQIGRSLDIQSIARAGHPAAANPAATACLDLYIRESAPVILDASAEADLARKMLSAPLVLSLPGGGGAPAPGPSSPTSWPRC